MERDTVLIVDDNQINCIILRKMLCSEYEIAEANDGTVALALLEKLRERVCLMVLDIWMPLLDGIGVLTAMRNKGWLGTIPVIVITSDATAELESRLLTFGVRYVISKPFDPVTVRDCVHDAINSHDETKSGQMLYSDAYRQKNLLTRVNTFLYEYDHANGVSHIDARYRKCLRGSWNSFNLTSPERVRDCIYRPDYPRFVEFLQRDCGSSYETLDLRLLTAAGVYEWFRIGMLRYDDERGIHTVLAFSNVTNEVRAREQLDFLARNDSLTQISNQQAFIDNTREMLTEHPQSRFVLLRIGVERFAILNQLYGRQEGDKLLRYVAVRLQERVEAGTLGTYCRLRADDFAACVSIDTESVDELIGDLQQMMEAYPVRFQVVLNFGLFYIDDSSMLIDDMLERANIAQKTVKGNYHRHIAVYDELLRSLDEKERMIIADMQEALEQRQFCMYLQPKCDMRSGRIVGSEALARWEHPLRGMISPGDFVPLFEENGFIAELDRYMFEEACRAIRSWIDRGYPLYPVSVNVSRADLYNPHLLEDILDLVEQYRIPHDMLGFELTESSFVVDNTVVGDLTELLKQHGFCVLMDDFGSGYSSLNTLKDIRVNILKIDLRFLEATTDVERANAILISICKMAQSIGLEIVMEGVETAEQEQLLKEIGVAYVQGFYYYKPLPLAEYERRILEEQARLTEQRPTEQQ